MRKWFVKPDTTRIDLGDGDWLEVKSKLTFKEREALTGAGLHAADRGNGMTVEMSYDQLKAARILAWVVDWSARDEQGKAMPVDQSTVENLDPDVADEIIAALDEYQRKLDEGKAPTPLARAAAS